MANTFFLFHDKTFSRFTFSLFLFIRYKYSLRCVPMCVYVFRWVLKPLSILMFLMHNTQIFTVQFSMFVRFDHSLLKKKYTVFSLRVCVSPSVSFTLCTVEKIHLQLSQLLSYFHLVALFHKCFQVHFIYTHVCVYVLSFCFLSVYVSVHTQ